MRYEDERDAAAARTDDRHDVMMALAEVQDRLHGTLTLSCACGDPAVGRILFIREGVEGYKSRPLCREHYHFSLDFWQRFRELAPDALADTQILVTGP